MNTKLLYEIRRKNLEYLIKIKCQGNAAAFARIISKDSTYINRCLYPPQKKGKKNIGDEIIIPTLKAFNLPSGWLDKEHPENAWSNADRSQLTGESNAEWIGGFDLWDENTPLDDDEVALPFFREVKLAAGSGCSSEVQENHGCKLRFARSTLKRQGVQIDHAYCVTVKGNSMEPVLPDGCTVGIDTSKKEVVNGDWYAIDHHGELRVKIIYRLPGGGYRLRSFNSDEYPDEHPVAEQDVRVLGRVFWWSSLR